MNKQVCVYDNVKSNVDLQQLATSEVALLASMLETQEACEEINEKLEADDFTFFVNKIIFALLCKYKNNQISHPSEDPMFDIPAQIAVDANLEHYQVFSILHSKPSNNIELDINEVLNFSTVKKEVMQSQTQPEDIDKSIVKIRYDCDEVKAIYYDGIVMQIETTNIFKLPVELCDTFYHTFANLQAFINQDNHQITMSEMLTKLSSKPIVEYSLVKNIQKP